MSERVAGGVPGRLTESDRQDVLSNYPTYLNPVRPQARARRSVPPLVVSVGTCVVAFIARMLAAVPIVALAYAHGVRLASSFPTADEVQRAAAVAALTTLAAMLVVGVVAVSVFLRICRVRPAFLIGFLGQVAEFIGGVVGIRISSPASLFLGALLAIGTTYVLIVKLKRPDPEQ